MRHQHDVRKPWLRANTQTKQGNARQPLSPHGFSCSLHCWLEASQHSCVEQTLWCSHLNHTASNSLGMISSSPERTAAHDRAAMSSHLTHLPHARHVRMHYALVTVLELPRQHAG